MQRVMIVEPSEADYTRLLELADWSRFGLKIITHQYDGESALEVIRRTWPDVVFTEIELPGMSGLELIEMVSGYDLQCDFVITSHTGRFETAKKALQLGVLDYLLKPLAQEELLSVLSRLTERGVLRRSEKSNANQRIWKIRKLLRNFFMQAITEEKPLGDLSLERLNETYCLHLQEGLFLAVVLTLDGVEPAEGRALLDEIVEQIRFVYDFICFDVIPFAQDGRRLTLIFNYAPEGTLETKITKMTVILKECLQELGCPEVDYCIAVGEPVETVEQLNITLVAARRSLCHRLFWGGNKLYRCDKMSFDSTTVGDILTPELIQRLRAGVEFLDFDSFSTAVHAAFGSLTGYNDPIVIMKMYRAILELVCLVFSQLGYGEISDDDKIALRHELGDATTLAGAVTSLLRWAKNQFGCCQQQRNNSGSVCATKEYIARHYMEELTLKETAAQIHLNPSYLSILFKKEADCTFSDYLTNYRLNVAKQLLLRGGMSIAEIGKAVGYKDSKYFSRIFTRVVGVKPSEYRALRE